MALSLDAITKLSTKKKIILLAAMIIVLGFLYAYFLFLPQREDLEALETDLNKSVRELNDSKTITRDLQKFKDQVQKLNAELTSALTQLPNEKEIPEILKNISSLGKESNLEFTLFRPKPEEQQQFYAKVPIELVFLGNYHNTGLFFDKVSKLPRIINVVDFNMTRAKDLKGRPETEIVVKTSCLMNTYRFVEKKAEEKKPEEKKTEEKKSEEKKGEKK